MSCKINGINCDTQWGKANLNDTSVKLAGEEAKDRLYEPKHKRKLGRVLTVIAYVFFVSLAAIMLSLYYIFLWNGDQKMLPKYEMHKQNEYKCANIIAEKQQQLLNMEDTFILPASTTQDPAAATTIWFDDDRPAADIDFRKEMKNNNFIKKLFQLDQTDSYNRD